MELHYMFRVSSLPSSGVFHCTFGTGKFHAGFDDRFQAESGWNCTTCFVYLPCPSSGVFHCTFDIGKFHAGF